MFSWIEYAKHRPCGGEWLRNRNLAQSLWLHHTPSQPGRFLVCIVTVPHGWEEISLRTDFWFAAHHRFMCYFKDCQPAQCNAQHQGFWSASSGLSACRAGMTVHNRESGLMLGLPCTSAFVGQETLLPVICHLPIGFQPWKGCLWTTCVWTHALATMKIS